MTLLQIDILSKFKQTTAFNTLISNPHVLMIYVGGSRSFDLQDEFSDYDIIFITDEYQKSLDWNDKLRWVYQNCHIHVYQDVIYDLIQNYKSHWGAGVALLNMHELTYDKLLYVNSSKADVVQTILSSCKLLSNIGSIGFSLNHQFLIRDFVNYNIKKDTKRFYHLCIAYYILLNKPLDKEFILKVKKSPYTPLSSENEIKLREMMVELRNHINNLKMCCPEGLFVNEHFHQ